LKAQGLWWRVEGKPGLAEKGVDEVGSALDLPEPAADDGLQFVEGARRGCPGRLGPPRSAIAWTVLIPYCSLGLL